ncbi:MAG: hypothetical protein GAK28_04397 [Luteibacter sp.]|uniref:hypothetical protein n=1 Tax=Luteibacter sp. TaxID=1886636 RepID=UPI001384783A|nr:hypothetical protein [Luteibacter sp.]KAF1003934.1 MAG: hypothetical protein GAK28_04397 [Luteibacter sp.]
MIATTTATAASDKPANTAIQPVPVDRLPAERQAFVLGMVQWNLFPTGFVLKRHPWFGKTRKGFDCLSGAGYSRLQELIAQGHQGAAERGLAVARDHWSDWAKRAVSELLAPLTDVRLEEAIQTAYRSSDETGLPQTVYRDGDSGGWSHTNAFANRLARAELAVTALPTRYFT